MESIYSPSGIPYAWMFYPDAYDEMFAAGSSQTISHLRVAWEDAGALKADLMYTASRDPGKSYLIRNNPLQHPEVEWHYLQQMNKYRLFHAAAPEVLPGGSGYGYQTQEYNETTGFWAMDRIVYQCSFTPFPFNVRTDLQVKSQTIPELHRYCTGQVIPQTINRKLPGLPFVMDDLNTDGSELAIPETASIPETTYKLVISLFGWPEEAIPYSTIYDRSNKVNSAAITIPAMGGFLGGTFAAETIRYDGLAGPVEPVIGPDGVRYVTIRHVLNVHSISGGWNKTLDYRNNPPTWGYFKVKNSAPPKRLYLLASLAELFIPV